MMDENAKITDIDLLVKFNPFEVKRQAPNAETKAALDEYEEMKKNPGNYKRYESFDELLGEWTKAGWKRERIQIYFRKHQEW